MCVAKFKVGDAVQHRSSAARLTILKLRDGEALCERPVLTTKRAPRWFRFTELQLAGEQRDMRHPHLVT